MVTQHDTALVRAPVWPLAVAGAMATASAALLLVATVLGLRTEWVLTATGYALGALVAPAGVVWYRFLSVAARRSVWFSPRRYDQAVASAVLVTGLALGLFHGVLLATELAK